MKIVKAELRRISLIFRRNVVFYLLKMDEFIHINFWKMDVIKWQLNLVSCRFGLQSCISELHSVQVLLYIVGQVFYVTINMDHVQF